MESVRSWWCNSTGLLDHCQLLAARSETERTACETSDSYVNSMQPTVNMGMLQLHARVGVARAPKRLLYEYVLAAIV